MHNNDNDPTPNLLLENAPDSCLGNKAALAPQLEDLDAEDDNVVSVCLYSPRFWCSAEQNISLLSFSATHPRNQTSRWP